MTALLKKRSLAWMFSASFLIFASSNFVNLGNLLFNLLFSRWMGPAQFSDLALLMTLMLSIMGVLNAVQFLVTERVAETDEQIRREYIGRYAKIAKQSSIVIAFALPALALFTIGTDLAEALGLENRRPLLLFYLGLPFYLPLALWRGVAQGRIDVRRILLTNNAEMFVRLIGGSVLWWLGFGLSGVIFALVLSIVIANLLAKPIIPNAYVLPPASRSKALPLKKAWPWAAMQLAVVLALDGDVFIAKIVFSAEEAGFVAAISLIQRIIFFASFALSAVLLPQTIEAIKRGELGLKTAIPVFGMIITSALVIILAVDLKPELIVATLFGKEFAPIAPLMVRAALSASLVTMSYFFVVFLLAHQKRYSAYVFLGLCFSQLVFMALWLRHSGGDFQQLVDFKLIFQCGVFAILSLTLLVSLIKTQVQSR